MEKILNEIDKRILTIVKEKGEHSDFVKGLYLAKQIVVDRTNKLSARSQWLNTEKMVAKPDQVIKPCHGLGFCPYGQLVEAFPLRKDRPTEYSCKIFGHDCPVFYHAEGTTEFVTEKRKKHYTKNVVLIEDKLLKDHGNIIGIGVQRRQKEIHLEIYVQTGVDMIFHRDIEVQPDGSYDSGCLTRQEDIAKRLKSRKK